MLIVYKPQILKCGAGLLLKSVEGRKSSEHGKTGFLSCNLVVAGKLSQVTFTPLVAKRFPQNFFKDSFRVGVSFSGAA